MSGHNWFWVTTSCVLNDYSPVYQNVVLTFYFLLDSEDKIKFKINGYNAKSDALNDLIWEIRNSCVSVNALLESHEHWSGRCCRTLTFVPALILLRVLFSQLPLRSAAADQQIERSSLLIAKESNLFSSPPQFFCWSSSLLELSITVGPLAVLYWLELSCHFSKSLGLALTSGTREGSGGATSDETGKASDGEEERGNGVIMMN